MSRKPNAEPSSLDYAEETFFHLTIGIRDMNKFCSDFAQAQFLDMVLKWRMRMLKEGNFMLTPT